MKRIVFIVSLFVFIASPAFAGFSDHLEESHNSFIYPVVRVTTDRAAGSGTVLYSKLADCGKAFSTYILTNYHVIDDAISIGEEWNSSLKKMVKLEKRAIVYVEIFQYRDISTPIGTLKVEADVVVYNKQEDMALLKLRSESAVTHVAKLRSKDKTDDFFVLDDSIAVGCSLAFPPLPTTGVITRKNFNIDSYPFHMSSAQIIYGNSGGAMFHTESGELIGIPSLVPVVGWGTPITHMGLFIPIARVYKWMEEEKYDFIFDATKNEKDCLEAREVELEEKRKEEERR